MYIILFFICIFLLFVIMLYLESLISHEISPLKHRLDNILKTKFI